MVDKSLRSVSLFYGTNRERTEPCLNRSSIRWEAESPCTPSTFYGNEPVETESARSGLEVGTMRVSFPPSHATGKIERPPRIFGFALRSADPGKDVLIAELRSFTDDYEGWVQEIRSTGRNQAFIYVHGYATTFAEAARRAAQVAYDLDFDLDEDFRGIPMVFSWPSRGGTAGYLVDYDVSLEATDAFNEFLDLVKLRAGVEFVHVIAHSMGNRVVANALTQRGDSGQAIVDQLVLAAPDIFSRRFRQRFLKTLPALAGRVTLYVSDKDRALNLSKEIREGEPRAGQVAGGLLEASAGVDRFDAIDASELETDFLAHSYYANNNSMLSDIYCLLKGTPAQERPLLVLAEAGWSFRPPESVTNLNAGGCSLLATPEPSRPWRRRLLGVLGLLLFAIATGWYVTRRRGPVPQVTPPA
jgi:esterase/lipase superfamily enzyme